MIGVAEMKEYTEKEIVALLHNNPDINFVAVAVTPWHAMGVDAVLYHLQEREIQLNGYIIVRPHQVTGIALSEENFSMRNVGKIQVIYEKLLWERESVKKKIQKKLDKVHYFHENLRERDEKKILYWIRPVNPSFDLYPILDTKEYNHHIVTILTDEGLGTYLNDRWVWAQVAIQEGNWKQAIRSVLNSYMAEWYYIPVLMRRKQLESYQLLKLQENKWIPNEDAVHSYQEILRKNQKSDRFDHYIGSAILNTGPYEKIVRDNREVQVLKKVCDVINQEGISVILKAHPREMTMEKYESLKCRVEENREISQEMILSSMRGCPICIIGFDSTTLVSSKLLFGIGAISINKLLPKEDLYDSKWYDVFNRTFGEIIRIPSTYDELEKDLKDMKEKYERNQKNVEDI